MKATRKRAAPDQRITQSVIERRLTTAAANLLDSQADFFHFTSATRQSEWNIAHHFAIELAPLFPGYKCDADVIKPGFGRKRPDVIVHERGVHRRNLLAVEMKRRKKDVAGEIRKIRTTWFRALLRYRFGAVVVINDSEDPHVVVIQNALWQRTAVARATDIGVRHRRL